MGQAGVGLRDDWWGRGVPGGEAGVSLRDIQASYPVLKGLSSPVLNSPAAAVSPLWYLPQSGEPTVLAEEEGALQSWALI